MRGPLLAACAAVVACVSQSSVRPYVGPDGSAWSAIECPDGRVQCLELAGRECSRGYDIDRDDGRSMTVQCKTPKAEPTHRAVSSRGIRFELPRDWAEHDGLWMSPDESGAVLTEATSVASSATAEAVATAVMANADERWSGKVHGQHVVFVTGEMRGAEDGGLRVTRAVTVRDSRAYLLTCAHRGTKSVSKVCMRVLNSMQIE